LADLIGRDTAAIARAEPGVAGSVVVDLFAGSGNTLYWITRHVGPRVAVGFELDDVVFSLARKGLSIVNLRIELIQGSYDSGLRALMVADDELLVVFVAPPWGRALDESSALDLRRTLPPIIDIVDQTVALFDAHKLLFAIQIHETVVSDSLTDLSSRFQWCALRAYDINAPGQNHGLLLGTCGWTA
jgi:predicted RNA methylase